MPKSNFYEIIKDIFQVDLSENIFREFEFEKRFEKKILKCNNKEIYVILNKIIEILQISDLSFYKNLRYDLKKYKRVHVNGSYVILFYDDENKKVYFIDYEHHDKIYKKQ